MTGKADAIIIGSGAGGAPAAALLAEAGRDVVVLEAGPRLATSDFDGDEARMTARLWRFAPVGRSMSVYAGRCVGGSTVINDALCFRTPPEILASWRDDHGLTGLGEATFGAFLDRAWEDVHASPTTRDHLNRNARALATGAERLGWSSSATPRNVRGCANLGLCNLGCPSGAKQSTLLTYVPRAERARARVLAATRARRVLFAGGRVTGVEASDESGTTVRIDAPLVCVAAGVLETPALLQRSGIPGAGRGIAFHSSVHVTALFPEAIHGYYGPTMAWAVDEFADVAGRRGPGVMIENTTVLPISAASALPGFGEEFAARMAQLPHLAKAVIVVRDRSRGTMDENGTLSHEMQTDDLERIRAGLVATARIYLAAGAREVWLPVVGVAAVRREGDLAEFERRRLTLADLCGTYAVHLFGGAAMGRDGIADEDGSVRGVRGLYVTDASALPSNTGVNPQITILANALRIASGLSAPGAPG